MYVGGVWRNFGKMCARKRCSGGLVWALHLEQTTKYIYFPLIFASSSLPIPSTATK